MEINKLKNFKQQVRLVSSFAISTDIEVEVQWNEKVCNTKLINKSENTFSIKEVVLFKGSIDYPPNTPIYGEGYNMLSQYGGTIEEFKSIGSFNEVNHYRLKQTKGFNTIYNMMMAFPENQNAILMGFTSCNRFGGQFRINEGEYEVVLDMEGIKILPNETIQLEEFFTAIGSKEQLLEQFAYQIQKNHPMLITEEIPTGWSSWLSYGPNVTAEDIYENMNTIKKDKLGLKFIQIDDGYQNYMGDWLEIAERFNGGVKKLCLDIKKQGFEPAIWVAPFIAEKDSKLFTNHPDWFVQDQNKQPLRSDRVTFGGWRCGPWYMLDGTNPGAREYLKSVFQEMREEWQVKYFKLDANMWGAMPFGKRYEENSTCIDAYRMAMKAIVEAVGIDSFILGCNAPMWPSLGVVHGMRITNDIARNWKSIRSLPRECFNRNWQNNTLWINDPDTIVLQNLNLDMVDPEGKIRLSDKTINNNEFMFNATYVLASGGMVLSGDKVMQLSDNNKNVIKKLIPSLGIAAVFDNNSYKIGRINLGNEQIICVFNYDDVPCNLDVKIEGSNILTDFWTDESIGEFEQVYPISNMEPHSSKALKLTRKVDRFK